MMAWISDATNVVAARVNSKANGAKAQVVGVGSIFQWRVISPTGNIVRVGNASSQALAESKAEALMNKLFP